MSEKKKLFKSEDDFDIILILGHDEKIFKSYIEKIHPDIIHDKHLREMLEYQIDKFKKDCRYLGWIDLYEKVFPNNEESDLLSKLDKKYTEDIKKQSLKLLEKRLSHLLVKKETFKAVFAYSKTGDPEMLHKNLDNARSIVKRKGVEIVEKDLSKVPKELPFLFEGRIVKGGLTFIAGRGGAGKSVFTTGSIIAPITAGGVDFNGNQLEQGFAFFFSEGEDLPTTVLNRIEINGGNKENFKWLEVKERIEGEGEEELEDFLSIFSLKHNLPDLKRRLRETPEEILTNSVLVIDGIGTFMGMEKALDSYNDMAVRKILSPLGRMAARLNIAIVIIGHFNKNSNKDLIDTIMASVAFKDVCRASYAIIVDEEKEDRHYFLPIKWNLKELYGTGIEFRIEKDTDRIIIVGEISVGQVRELKGGKEPGEYRGLGAGERARRFLVSILKDRTYHKWTEIDKMMRQNKINQKTLYSAMHDMGIRSKYINGICFWIWDKQSTEKELSEKFPEKEIKVPEEKDLKEKIAEAKVKIKAKKEQQRSPDAPEKEGLTLEKIAINIAKIRAKHQDSSETKS